MPKLGKKEKTRYLESIAPLLEQVTYDWIRLSKESLTPEFISSVKFEITKSRNSKRLEKAFYLREFCPTSLTTEETQVGTFIDSGHGLDLVVPNNLGSNARFEFLSKNIKPSRMTLSLATVFFGMLITLTSYPDIIGTKSQVLQKLENIEDRENKLDVGVRGGFYETYGALVRILLNSTEMITDKKTRIRVLTRLVTENLMPEPFSKFDSYLSALSFTGNGFWGPEFNSLHTSGFLAQGLHENRCLIDPKFIHILNKYRQLKPDNFHGGCPVRKARTSQIEQKLCASHNPKKLSAITLIGQYIVETAISLEKKYPEFF